VSRAPTGPCPSRTASPPRPYPVLRLIEAVSDCPRSILGHQSCESLGNLVQPVVGIKIGSSSCAVAVSCS
jgi:hypothetical protein